MGIRCVWVSAIAMLLVACGGGDKEDPGGSNPPPPPVNRAPVANAGADQAGTTGQAMTLNGAASSDPDGNVLTYEWTIESGPAGGGALTTATSASAGFTATAAGTYVVRLTVKDPSNSTGTATISLTITAPPVADGSIVVDKAFLFMTATGQTAALTAQVFDAAGAPVTTTVTWTSSAPTLVNVDSSGHLVASALGSAQIVAHAGGLSSAPTLVMVAEPKAGAVLVTDAQIESIGAPIGIAPGEPAVVGTQYEVRLVGVPAPAPGTVLLAAETSPVAGKVVSTRMDGTTVVVTLAIAALPDLMARYHIDLAIDLSKFPLELTPPPAKASYRRVAKTRPGGPVMEADSPLKKLENFYCEGDVEGKLGNISITATANSSLEFELKDYRDDPALPPNYSRHVIKGSIGFEGTAAVVFKPRVEFSGGCYAEAHIKLPVFGWVSAIVMPQISVGVGFELSSELIVTTAEIGGKFNFDVKPVAGWECSGTALACQSLDQVTAEAKFAPKQEFDIRNGMHATLDGHLFGYARLDALALGGLAGYVPILEARIGPKQSFDLAFMDTQARNRSLASDYDLKIDGSIKPGKAIKDALKKLVNDDHIELNFGAKLSIPIAESPKGTLSVSKARVPLGDTVTFAVDIDPATTDYPGIGENFAKAYNIEQIMLYRRKVDAFDDDFEYWKSMPSLASGSVTHFTYDWKPEGMDAGKWEYAAFVSTKFPVPFLEIAKDSVKEVEVSCFSATQKMANKGALADTCADVWEGSSGHTGFHLESVSAEHITWEKDLSYVGPPTTVAYTAKGSFEFHHLVFEEAGCTQTPTRFEIAPPGPTVSNYLFVDYVTSPAPARFAGNGIQVVTITVACPDEEAFEVVGSVSWFGGVGTVNPDGLTIEGSASNAFGTSAYKFTRP